MFFYSDGIKDEQERPSFGAPHYSYQIPSQRFAALFRSPIHLARPEIYSPKALEIQYGCEAFSPKPAHLIFRPFHGIRFLKGARNIVHIPWEFNHLALERRSDEIWNQLSLLRQSDEIWTPSQFSKRVLSRHLENEIHIVPTPIPYSENIYPRTPSYKRISLRNFRSINGVPLSLYFGQDITANHRLTVRPIGDLIPDLDNRTIFLSVINPGDFRKNLEQILRGFTIFNNIYPQTALIVKLIIDNEKTTLENAQQGTIGAKFLEKTGLSCRSVLFISTALSDHELSALYSAADFYVCASHGEGQNLPLLEAMGHGVVPVSVNNTAMADYITTNCSFVVSSKEKRIFCPEFSEFTQNGWVDTYTVALSDLVEKLVAAMTTNLDTVRAMRAACVATVRRDYGAEAIHRLLQRSSVRTEII